ncbi:MAG TPA: NUDIX domain-containing protein, partial [Candidatus Paceibacterota bacterium]|nr:NUDIX domain-containing protein [Candidatus Paceibacterota bacterium]
EEADSGIARETMEEAGIEVEAPRVFHVISRTNPLDEFWTTIYYVARARTDTVTLSYEHDTYQWVTIEEFLALQGASRNNEAVARYVALHKAGRV